MRGYFVVANLTVIGASANVRAAHTRLTREPAQRRFGQVAG
jgi:hypothetical protein